MNTATILLLVFVHIALSSTEQISLKLVGGSTAYEGNVLVRRGSDWGLVCDDEWDVADGNVVCHQLGYGKAIKVTTYNKFYSSISESIFLDDVKCQGHESNLGECMHREWMMSNCNAGEAAGVVCADDLVVQAQIKETPSDGQRHRQRLAMRIVAKTNQQFSTTDAYRQPEPEELPVTVSPLSEESDVEEEVDEEVPINSDYSQRTRELLARVHDLLNSFPQVPVYEPPQPLDGESENAHSGRLDISLTHDGLSALDSDHQETDSSLGGAYSALRGLEGSFVAGSANVESPPALIQPREVTEDEIEEVDQVIEEMRFKSDQPSAAAARPVYVEVVGGRRSNEGYVKVTMDNGKTGVICSDNWGIYEAMVVCRQTGKQQVEKATLIDYFGARNQDKVVYEVHCDGHERTLADCEYKLSDRHGVKCSKPMNVAGVVCTSAKLPDLMPNVWALQTSLRIEEKPLHSLTCAMEENCLSSSARTASAQSNTNSYGFSGMFGGFNTGPTRRLLRFSSNIYNNGTADFRPRQHRSGWEWHSCHQHYHSMGAFSHYDILDSHGNRVAEGHKASFCLEDVECKWPHTKKYSCRGFADQGISAGCADVYASDIDCQWIDITDLQPGAYVFKLNVNPSLEVPELSFDNNAAICELNYNGYSAKLTNCVLSRG